MASDFHLDGVEETRRRRMHLRRALHLLADTCLDIIENKEPNKKAKIADGNCRLFVWRTLVCNLGEKPAAGRGWRVLNTPRAIGWWSPSGQPR